MKTLSMFVVIGIFLVVLFPTPAYAEVECWRMMDEGSQARCEAEKVAATKVVTPTTPPRPPKVDPPKPNGFSLSGGWIIGLLVATLILSVVINLILLRKLREDMVGTYGILVNALLKKKVIDQTDLTP